MVLVLMSRVVLVSLLLGTSYSEYYIVFCGGHLFVFGEL